MHTLFDYRYSGNAWKARELLGLLGVEHRLVEVDVTAGEARTPAFRARNPVGEVPVLELPDGTCLAESHAIVLYLAEGTPWLPDDRVARAHVVRWLCFEQTHIDGVLSRARFRRMCPGLIPTSEVEFRVWHEQGRRALGVLDTHLHDRTWLEGPSPTVADLCVVAYVQVADEAAHDLAEWPAVGRWVERVLAVPGIRPLARFSNR